MADFELTDGTSYFHQWSVNSSDEVAVRWMAPEDDIYNQSTDVVSVCFYICTTFPPVLCVCIVVIWCNCMRDSPVEELLTQEY